MSSPAESASGLREVIRSHPKGGYYSPFAQPHPERSPKKGNVFSPHQWDINPLELMQNSNEPPESERMPKNVISSLAAVALALAAGSVAQAQTYSNAVIGLNPVGYWPLTETTQPPFAYYVATNLGTAGAFGNGVYQTWYHPVTIGTSNVYYISNNIVRTTGATGDGD